MPTRMVCRMRMGNILSHTFLILSLLMDIRQASGERWALPLVRHERPMAFIPLSAT